MGQVGGRRGPNAGNPSEMVSEMCCHAALLELLMDIHNTRIPHKFHCQHPLPPRPQNTTTTHQLLRRLDVPAGDDAVEELGQEQVGMDGRTQLEEACRGGLLPAVAGGRVREHGGAACSSHRHFSRGHHGSVAWQGVVLRRGIPSAPKMAPTPHTWGSSTAK